MNFFYLIMLISCLCLGLRTISDTDKLLAPLKDFLGKVLPLWLWLPVIGCCACMASFWGTIVFWTVEFSTLGIISSLTFVRWIGVCISAAFFNELGWSIIILIKEY